MPFIRLSDDYNDHPKFDRLSDGAFRLWHQAMGFCRKYQTDGLIPTSSLRKLKAYSPKRMRELMTPWKDGAHPLWETVEDFGVKVHDYLEWNLSKEEEQSERSATAARVRRFRSLQRNGVTGGVTSTVSNGDVPDRIGSDQKEEREERDREPFERFWRDYPRKVGKEAAWKVWQKLTPDEDLLALMLAALAWQRQQESWVKDGGQFIPHPSTWLNQGRWQDEPCVTVADPKPENKRIAAAMAGTAQFLNRGEHD